MLRFACTPRPHWQTLAREYGFHFHTLDGLPYWDESACYQFTLEQIEQDLEAPTTALHQMCLLAVEQVVHDERRLHQFAIPREHWDAVRLSWQRRDPSLYSRLDFSYDGTSPAKLLENNADTPTSLYETGFWQWLWLEEQIGSGALHAQSDQFNSLQEKLIARFAELHRRQPGTPLHVACCHDSAEDRGTVQYLMDCAVQAGVNTTFLAMDDIGINADGQLTDLEDQHIQWLFKLYPWEFMLRETFGQSIPLSRTRFLEPLWKCVLSNKALLPLLWEMFPGHPNLLPAYFCDDPRAATLTHFVRKPLFSREGANIALVRNGVTIESEAGPYGAEGHIVQALQPLPDFGGRYPLVGSWLVHDQAAGISVREDDSLITRNSSRFLPHIILG